MSFLQQLATSLVGHLVASDCPDAMAVRLEFDTLYPESSSRTLFMEYRNRIADVESAFNLLHLLQHLNGTAFEYISRHTLERINPIVFPTLIRHNRAKGSAYMLHVRRYGLWMPFDEKPAATRLLIPHTANRRSEVDGAAFLYARVLVGGFVEPSTTNLIWEKATTAGLYCQKVDIFTEVESRWTTAQEHSLMNEMVEVCLFAIDDMGWKGSNNCFILL